MDEKQKQEDAEFAIKTFQMYKVNGESIYRLTSHHIRGEYTDDQATRVKAIDLHFLFGLISSLGLLKKTLEESCTDEYETREIFHMANVMDQGEKYADWCDEFLKATYDQNSETAIKISKAAGDAFLKFEEIKQKEDMDEEARGDEARIISYALGNLYKDDDIVF